MGGHGNFLEKCIPSLTAKDLDTNVFLNQVPISTYKFSKLISIHFFEELVERIW